MCARVKHIVSMFSLTYSFTSLVTVLFKPKHQYFLCLPVCSMPETKSGRQKCSFVKIVRGIPDIDRRVLCNSRTRCYLFGSFKRVRANCTVQCKLKRNNGYNDIWTFMYISFKTPNPRIFKVLFMTKTYVHVWLIQKIFTVKSLHFYPINLTEILSHQLCCTHMLRVYEMSLQIFLHLHWLLAYCGLCIFACILLPMEIDLLLHCIYRIRLKRT